MKSIGELITAANADEGEQPAPVQAATPRLHRVTLCAMTFAHFELVADSPLAAMRAAEEKAKESKLFFRTTPNAHKVEVQRRTDPRDPLSPLKWVEVRPT